MIVNPLVNISYLYFFSYSTFVFMLFSWFTISSYYSFLLLYNNIISLYS